MTHVKRIQHLAYLLHSVTGLRTTSVASPVPRFCDNFGQLNRLWIRGLADLPVKESECHSPQPSLSLWLFHQEKRDFALAEKRNAGNNAGQRQGVCLRWQPVAARVRSKEDPGSSEHLPPEQSGTTEGGPPKSDEYTAGAGSGWDVQQLSRHEADRDPVPTGERSQSY